MLKVLSNILCDLDPKVKAIGQKAGICDGVPSTSALVFFLSVVWSTTAQMMTFFCFRFLEVLFGSPGHDLHLSSITLNLLSPQLTCLMVLKCNLFVYHGN